MSVQRSLLVDFEDDLCRKYRLLIPLSLPADCRLSAFTTTLDTKDWIERPTCRECPIRYRIPRAIDPAYKGRVLLRLPLLKRYINLTIGLLSPTQAFRSISQRQRSIGTSAFCRTTRSARNSTHYCTPFTCARRRTTTVACGQEVRS